MSKQELTPAQREWLCDLRSGKFEQIDGRLEKHGGYCCLGVACKTYARITGLTGLSDTLRRHPDGLFAGLLVGDDLSDGQPKVWKWLGLHADGEAECVRMNDDMSFDFSQIADVIEADPAAFFKASVELGGKAAKDTTFITKQEQAK